MGAHMDAHTPQWVAKAAGVSPGMVQVLQCAVDEGGGGGLGRRRLLATAAAAAVSLTMSVDCGTSAEASRVVRRLVVASGTGSEALAGLVGGPVTISASQVR